MAIKEFFLYRAKFIRPSQLLIFAENISASDLFLRAINDKPELLLKSECEWHIGNIVMMGDSAGSFAVGKTTKTTVEKFDKNTGDFLDKIEDSGPYTRVFFDCRIGLLGIAKKSKLAPDAGAVARKIQALFENSKTVINSGVDVRVDFIPDPQSFLDKLKSAYAITKFKATFTGPNPIDADELFQKPLSVYAREMGADKGSVEVQGRSLNENTSEEVAKASAATGNTASARIIAKKGDKSVPIKMKGSAASITVEEDATSSDILDNMKNEYQRIRG